MRRDHDLPRAESFEVALDADIARPEIGQDAIVVDKVAQYGERGLPGVFLSQGDGVADAEAHAEVICADDFHGAIEFS
jgi:hypothetical protein